MASPHVINFINDTRALAGALSDAFNRARARALEAVAVGLLDPNVEGHITDQDLIDAGHSDLTAQNLRDFYGTVAAIGGFTDGGHNTNVYRTKNS